MLAFRASLVPIEFHSKKFFFLIVFKNVWNVKKNHFPLRFFSLSEYAYVSGFRYSRLLKNEKFVESSCVKIFRFPTLTTH